MVVRVEWRLPSFSAFSDPRSDFDQLKHGCDPFQLYPLEKAKPSKSLSLGLGKAIVKIQNLEAFLVSKSLIYQRSGPVFRLLTGKNPSRKCLGLPGPCGLCDSYSKLWSLMETNSFTGSQWNLISKAGDSWGQTRLDDCVEPECGHLWLKRKRRWVYWEIKKKRERENHPY